MGLRITDSGFFFLEAPHWLLAARLGLRPSEAQSAVQRCEREHRGRPISPPEAAALFLHAMQPFAVVRSPC